MLPKQDMKVFDDPDDALETNPPVPEESVKLKNTLVPLFQAPSKLIYPEPVKEPGFVPVKLDLTTTAVEVAIENADLLSPEEFTNSRRDGFGASDSGILLGVNPYTTLTELIKQKATKTISAEEAAISTQPAVMKGNDLEPLIITKFAKAFDMETIKPTDSYRFRDYPYLKINFDGVTGSPAQYLPSEIKVVTQRGEHHYNPYTGIYNSKEGHKPLPKNFSLSNNSIRTKSELYGIPPYYYTQIQVEMMALNAPFGFLSSLWEASWTLHVYLIYQDPTVWSAIKVAGYQAWQKVEALRQKNGYYNS